MKTAITFFCTLFFAHFASAQQSSSSAVQGTEIKQEVKSNVVEKSTPVPAETIFFKETEFDFGQIPQGKPVTHVFNFTNTGTSTLALENVQTSCGCTTPDWSKDPIARGGSSLITVGYNAMSEGTFTKFITVTYNGNQTKRIIIKGEVWKTPDNSAPLNEALNSLKNQ